MQISILHDPLDVIQELKDLTRKKAIHWSVHKGILSSSLYFQSGDPYVFEVIFINHQEPNAEPHQAVISVKYKGQLVVNYLLEDKELIEIIRRDAGLHKEQFEAVLNKTLEKYTTRRTESWTGRPSG
jgi:hypothetical protein